MKYSWGGEARFNIHIDELHIERLLQDILFKIIWFHFNTPQQLHIFTQTQSVGTKIIFRIRCNKTWRKIKVNQNFPQFSSTSDKRCDILLYFIEILFWTFWILLTFPYYLMRTNILFWMMGEIAAIRRGSYQMHLPSQRWDYMGSLRIHFDAMQKLSAYRLWCLLPGFAYCCPALGFVAPLWYFLLSGFYIVARLWFLLPRFGICCPALIFLVACIL